MMRLISKVYVKPENQEKFLEIIKTFVETAKTEEGYLDYSMNRSYENPDLFIFIERWTNREVQIEHCKTPFSEKYAPEMFGLTYQVDEVEFFEEIFC